MSQLSYVDPRYKPGQSDLICEYYVRPAAGVTLRQAADAIACESSIGTWTDIGTMSKSIARRLAPHVFSVDNNTGVIKIAYDIDLFERGNVPQLLSSIAGNIFGMRVLKSLRLEDIRFPAAYLSGFKGPKFGVKGVRNLLRVEERPVLGTIVKPKLGLTARQHAKVAYRTWVGGIDAVKDDENLTSMVFNRFKDRVAATLKKRDKAEKKTGEKKVYFPNITSDTFEMLKRARDVKKLGGEYVMIDIITCGWAALQALRNADLGLAIHAHRAGHGMFTEHREHGMSMLVVAKLARLIGVDQIHVGAIVGKMRGGASEVEHIGEEITEDFVRPADKDHILSQRWKGIKSVFPVCSGGLHPGLVGKLMFHMGNDIIIQAGGGIHGHPDGTTAGARAMRQAVDAALLGVPAKRYASTHGELRKALEKWC